MNEKGGQQAAVFKKILVTGGAGFIGSNFVKFLAAAHPDWMIVNLDALTYAGNLKNISSLEHNPRHVFVKGDITDRDHLAALFREFDFDYVVNLAAESHVDRSITDAGVFIRTNVMGTQCLLDCAKESWQTGCNKAGYPVFRNGVKFLQVSTDEVYGSLGKAGLFRETSPLKPGSPYAASKASADLIVMAYGHTYHLPYNITRCSNNYGPYQYPEKLIPLMIKNALCDKPLPVYGDGMQIRDWLFVGDHCRALDMVLEKGERGEVYNIGGGSEKTNIEIVRRIVDRLKKTQTLIQHVEDRLGHDIRYAMDIDKINSRFGWAPRYTFEQGLDMTIDWYMDNREWLGI